MRLASRILLLAINAIIAVALCLATLAPFIRPSSFVLLAYCGIIFPVLFWLNACCIIPWLFTRHKLFCIGPLIVLIISLPSFNRNYSFFAPQQHSLYNDSDKAGHTLHIMTYNTHQCQHARKTPGNDALRFVRESGADIVFLQEYEVHKNADYLTFEEAKTYLAEQYPYTYFDFAVYNKRRQYGVAVFSRYPLINKQTIRYESRANISNRCDVVVGTDTFRLFNNHLESNRVDNADLDPLTVERLSGDNMRRSLSTVTRKMSEAYRSRATEVQRVREEIAASPYPVIVAGDMNDVPASFTYRQLCTARPKIQDAFLAAPCIVYPSHQRSFIGHTFFLSDIPLLQHYGVRIDYLFVDNLFRITGSALHQPQSLDTNLLVSDHLPFSATISW